MVFDLQGFADTYERMRVLAQSNPNAAAQEVAVLYASDTPFLINETGRLLTLVSQGYGLLADIESELTAGLDTINRRSDVAAWLEEVRKGA